MNFVCGFDIIMHMGKKLQIKSGGRKWWALKVFVLTFALALIMSLFSELMLPESTLIVSLSVLFALVIIGIISDILGIAVAAATIAPFTAMAAKRIRGAQEAIRLIQRADKVANICNDVIGDVCGIVSGAAGASIAARLTLLDAPKFLPAIVLSSLIAALTVGGKALGKRVALRNSRQIVHFAGRVASVFHKTPKEKEL